MSFGSIGVDRVCSLQKILTRLRVTNFCTSSARFAPSFVRQPNGPKCTKFVRNAPKHEFRVQWSGSGVFIAKNSDATSWHELLHQFGPFCSEFRKATKRSQMHQNCTNAPKHEFLSNGVDRVRSLRKILTRLRGTNFCTISARFAPSFVTQPNGPQRTKIVRNAPKHEFMVQWGGSGAFFAKNYNVTSWHGLLH